MKLLSRLFNRPKTPATLTCPRCLGKGHVDKADIIRLKQQGKWLPGSCAYCTGSGIVSMELLTKVAVDNTSLTNNLTAIERDHLINKTQRPGCPVTEHNRLWLEDAFLLLVDLFGAEKIRQGRILTPHPSDFPITYNGTEQPVYETMKIVAAQMEVLFDAITLSYYDDRIRELSTGSPLGGKIYPESMKGDQTSAGLYWGQTEDGHYEIWLNRELLSQPENLVATLAHEIAHIKLIGENRVEINNEPLTDLTTMIFGLGIFTANATFQTFKDYSSYGWKSQGYLSQIQWGYALGLFAHIRGEHPPAWIDHLTPNVKSDFLQAQQFIADHPDIVFQTKLEDK